MESIYNLIPQPEEAINKAKMYRSKHNPRAPVTGTTFCTNTTSALPGANLGNNLEMEAKVGIGQHSGRANRGTFGPKAEGKPNPSAFLRSGERMSTITAAQAHDVAPFRYSGNRKQAVPTKFEKPVMGLHTAKNFITANAVEAILQVPRVPDDSQPDYRRKADYGQVPAYLSQVKDEIHRENEMIDAYVKEQMGVQEQEQSQMVEMDEGERQELIGALKYKWGALNAKYQKICHIVKLDTIGKVRRKEAMERELKQLESDIDKLESRSCVMIAD